HRFYCAPTLMPSELVVRFGESASINCTSSHPDFEGMGWEAPHGGSGFVKIPIVTWKVERVEVWKPDPFCYVTLKNDEQCTVHIQTSLSIVTDYKCVSLFTNYVLLLQRRLIVCQNLIVEWYRDHEKVHTETFKNDISKHPNNVTSTWKMIPKKSYNGTKFTCKAELDLGPKGPEPVPTATSEPYIAVVHCEFSINLFIILFPHTHLSKNITIKATSTNAGVYICVATNEFGKVTRSVTLKIKGMIFDCVMDTFGRFSWWHLVLKALIILIAFLLLVLFINLWRNHTIHRQYSFINPAIPLTTRA
uniref:CD80-like immunoglobulin C2-set domain-containing protein n=1 Tax=Anabas testudineus TaxID=64144 RepID=A0A7N6FHX3_ANATE